MGASDFNARRSWTRPEFIDGVLVAVFALTLLVPGLFWFRGKDERALVHQENREPAPFPRPPHSLEELSRWTDGFESWFNDSFPGRHLLIRNRNRLRWMMGGTLDAKVCLVGKERWIFTRDNDVVEKHLGQRPFTSERLREITTTLERRRAWLKERGIRYLLVVGPDKHGIYPGNMPSWFHEARGATPMDQLVAALPDDFADSFLDLRDLLRGEASRELIYYRLGTHWNDLGAFHAARAIADRLRTWFPDMPGLQLSDWRIRWERGLGDSWGRQLHMEDDLTQRLPRLQSLRPKPWREVSTWIKGAKDLVTRRADGKGPRIMILHDSFGEVPRVYLAGCASSLTAVWNLYFEDRLIETHQPDVLIHLVVERNLDQGVFKGGGRARVDLGGKALAAARRRATGTWTNPVLGEMKVVDDPGGDLVLTSPQGRIPLVNRGPFNWAGKAPPFDAMRVEITPASAWSPESLQVVDPRVPAPLVWVRPAEVPKTGPFARIVGRYERDGEITTIVPVDRRAAIFGASGEFLGLLSPLDEEGETFQIEGRLRCRVVRTADGLDLHLPAGRLHAKRLP